MKRSKTTALLLMGAAPLLFTACQREQPVQMQEGLFTSVERCTEATGDASNCRVAFEQARQQAADAAPQYGSREACARDYPAEDCVEQRTTAGHSFIGPMMAGFFLSQMMSGNRAGLAQQPAAGQARGAAAARPQATPAWRSNTDGWLRPSGATAAGRAGLTPVAATPDRAMTAQRGGFGASGRGRSSGG
ncbi:DUF1190 domain-containing protein [Luteimonas sp. RC10]|uniref:DUF1190 domain-containing protein n=1 Tax=Luteimonas sp. RC10 TaxID=2587035 RepID=UPI001607DF03|nr:DUF1190 domain-containing protein [Luteimonas sp. RC10]MBB3342714.1 uncharacterized protein YgiB involved in biofilm formation [Luteimonas sp. RC10]